MTQQNTIQRTIITHSPSQTRALASRLADACALPAVIALDGQLGAGKTEFVKGLGGKFGIAEEDICSATFVIICEYGESPCLMHVDAYRLTSGEELEAIGWEEMLSRDDCLIAIEWADRVRNEIPPESLWVRMELVGPTERRITIEAISGSTWGNIISEFE